ncbi:MAG: FG-GAP-like repeat-containing protein [Vicinamibacterales bacterium]
MSSYLPRLAAALLAAAVASSPPLVAAQDHTGDLLGDLVHIKRDATTGQPILQKRWVDLGSGVLDWAYCPIPVDAAGAEIPFAPLSCDPDPAELSRLVEVDYFGRLSGGRTKERNQRMHFDEIILNINDAEAVDVDVAGRLMLGTACDQSGLCGAWKTVDSPMENLAIYRHLLKYGHIQTDPLEVDTDPGGDPSSGVVYHPALVEADWAKFRGVTTALLPRSSANQCFNGAAFTAACADPQALTNVDFAFVTSFLGGAADKTGIITPDLVQYLNRLLKIPIATPETAAPVTTLPALIRDDMGAIAPAPPGLPFPADERFVDFSPIGYLRTDWFNRSALLLQSPDNGQTWQPTTVQLLQWLAYANGPPPPMAGDMPGFVAWASDALRVVEFMHEYEVPANLWGGGTGTHTVVNGVTVRYRATDQSVGLTAHVDSTATVNGGTVTFSVRATDGGNVGAAVTSGPVVAGAASATYVLPGGTSPATLSIVAVYTGTASFATSSGAGSLVIGLADTTTTVDAVNIPVPTVPTGVPLTAHVAWGDSVPIGEGTVTFAVTDGNGGPVGTPVVTAVAGGTATATYLLPALPAQRLTTTVTYGGSTRFAPSTGSNVFSVGCVAVTIRPFTVPNGTVGESYAAAFSTDGVPPTTLTFGTLPPGLTGTGAMITGTPTTSGSFSFTVAATDAAGCTGSASYTMRIDPSANVIAVGPDAGVPGLVRHFEPNGTAVPSGEYAPFTMAWTGGVRVARADFTGDGVADTVVAAGPGGAPLVSIYNGATASLIATLPAFEASYTGGVHVAAGDLTGDGTPDLVVGAATGSARVRIFNGRTGALVADFVALSDAGVSGVQVAVGDVNADGLADLVVGAGPGGVPRVRVYSAATGAVLHDFLAFTSDFRGGVFVAAGDLTADGRTDLVVGAGPGGAPLVRAYNGVSGALIREFMPFDVAFRGGVRVASADLTADGHAEIVVGAGPSGAPIVRVYHGVTNAVLTSFMPYPSTVTSGVFVAVPWRPPAPAPPTTSAPATGATTP